MKRTQRPRLLVLGGRDHAPKHSWTQPSNRPALGWHLNELVHAGQRFDADVFLADYESLRGEMSLHPSVASAPLDEPREEPISGTHQCVSASCWDTRTETLADQSAHSFDAILTRTMPAGSLEQVTFRLACLHHLVHHEDTRIVNPPSALELAIDKYATLSRVASIGYPVPPTVVAQSRSSAMDAFDTLGGDVVVKPIFGGEGRGVMRVREPELAWTVFSALEQTASVCYVQQFIPPGGVDVRLLVIGDRVRAIQRTSDVDFRTNVRGGGRSQLIELQPNWEEMALHICRTFGLKFAAVDFLEKENGSELAVMEVNAIPGWRAAQGAVNDSIAEEIIAMLLQQVES